MKRSEIEHQICEIIYAGMDSEGRFNSLGQVASEILDYLKECGMKPPKWKGKSPGHFPGDEHEFEMECWEEEYYE